MSTQHLKAKVAVAVVLLATISGCARTERSHEVTNACACEDANAKAVDQALMAWLSKARTLHHLADLAEGDEQAGDAGAASIDKAIAPLDQLVTGAVPTGNPPEVREVLADTYARLAELRARRGDFERADKDVRIGLGYAPDNTYFRGHLLEVRGLIYDRLSQNLEKAGRSEEAKAARQKAMQASFEAVRLQDEVIKSTLGDAGSKARD
jgi:tetratricopeptide (TPR) repeat protein